jgi:hypothetical protein
MLTLHGVHQDGGGNDIQSGSILRELCDKTNHWPYDCVREVRGVKISSFYFFNSIIDPDFAFWNEFINIIMTAFCKIDIKTASN